MASAGNSSYFRALSKETPAMASAKNDHVSVPRWSSEIAYCQTYMQLAKANDESASRVLDLLTKSLDCAVAREFFSVFSGDTVSGAVEGPSKEFLLADACKD